MSWVTTTLSSSLGRKVIMSLTGLFLCTFLIVHLIGNLQLFKGDEGQAFNEYSYFMTHNPVIKTISYLLYSSIIIHAIMALVLTRHNQAARPINYAFAKPEANSPWNSRNMGILGTIILIFIIIHMRTFWYTMHFGPVTLAGEEIQPGSIPEVTYDGEPIKNLYAITTFAFSYLWYVALYVVSMIALGFHLVHGFKSAFQTFGWRHKKYTPLVEFVGTFGFGVLIPAIFAAMPVYIYLKTHHIIF